MYNKTPINNKKRDNIFYFTIQITYCGYLICQTIAIPMNIHNKFLQEDLRKLINDLYTLHYAFLWLSETLHFSVLWEMDKLGAFSAMFFIIFFFQVERLFVTTR